MTMPTLLAVDDRPENLFLLEKLIGETCPDIHLLQARGPLEGLEIASQNSVDLFLIDVQMPAMDGIEMCRRLKSNPRTCHAPVILITAYQTSPVVKSHGFEAGAEDFIQRPIDPVELAARIRAMLRMKSAEDELRREKEKLEEKVVRRTFQLFEAEKRYRNLFNSISDPVLIHEFSGKIWEVNQAACLRYGYSKDDFRGMKICDILAPETRPLFPARMEQLQKSGQALFESVHITHAGEIFPVEAHIRLADYEGREMAVVTVRDIAERKEAEKRLQNSLVEKTVLLRELYHRSRNNLNVVRGLIDLQADEVTDPKALHALRGTSSRIRMMGLVHQKLCDSGDLARIDLKEYIEDMIGSLWMALPLPPNISVRAELESVYVSMDSAMPCGLILHELISNSLRHAFPANQRGRVNISLRTVEGEIRLRVQDDGVGLPPGFEVRKTAALGLQLAMDLVHRQLKGFIETLPPPGTGFLIRFRDLPISGRFDSKQHVEPNLRAC